MIDASLLDLPWATLVTLASGYIGYFMAMYALNVVNLTGPRHYLDWRRILECHKAPTNHLILKKKEWGLLDLQHLTHT